MDHYANCLESAVLQISKICQQSNSQISQFFDDLNSTQHSQYIPYTINRYNKDIYEQPFRKNNMVAEYMYDVTSLSFNEDRKYMTQYMNYFYSEIAKDIVKFIHDNSSGAYNAEISRHFGFSKYNYDTKGNKYNDPDFISHNILSMMVNRGILQKLDKESQKIYYKVISSKEFDSICIYDIKNRFASKYEAKIAYLLEKSNIEFIPQYRYNECRDKKPLPFDFYLPEYDILIEIQGEQHYKSVNFFGGEEGFIERVRHDNIKYSFAKVNNIKLVIIKYDDVNKIKDIKKWLNR